MTLKAVKYIIILGKERKISEAVVHNIETLVQWVEGTIDRPLNAFILTMLLSNYHLDASLFTGRNSSSGRYVHLTDGYKIRPSMIQCNNHVG